MTVLPTGAQILLRRGDAEATVVEVGGGLRSYRMAGRELLDGYDATEMAEPCRGQVLVPWPNRLRDGAYAWNGALHVLPLTEPSRANAIHGLVRFVPWQVAERTDDRVVVTVRLYPQPGYPFVLRVSVAYALTDAGLVVTTTATNDGDVPLPYGEGHHPYLAAGAGLRLDDCLVVAPAATRLETDDRAIPTGAVPVEGTPYDLRAGRVLDHAFTDLARDADGRAWTRLVAPDGRGAALWQDPGYPWLQLYSADTIAGLGFRRGLAVEPMTCPPNALQSGQDVRRLDPGEWTSASWGIVPLG